MALTNADKNWIKGALVTAMEEQEGRLDAKIDKIKDDFYTKIDPILKEVVASREERQVVSHRLSDHEDRIEKVEKKLSLQT